VANFIARVGAGLSAGFSAFREAYMNSDALEAASFGDFGARQLRYRIAWAFYENNAYRNVHTWAIRYKTEYGLYRYIRNIYNPASRIGDRWQAYLLGGELDPAAGDGKHLNSAIPIATDLKGAPANALRAGIAQVWQWSNWQINKDIFTLNGAVFGDTALQIVDETDRQHVYFKIVNPAIIKRVELDPQGNVKSYEFEEQRPDPDGKQRMVTYNEICERETAGGRNTDAVIFRTLLNGNPYAWNGKTAEWSEPYGFVPLVMVKHNDVGLDWGWSELHPNRSKIHEIDDVASNIDDYIRKIVQSPQLVAGVKKPEVGNVTAQGALRRVSAPEVGREEMPFFYVADKDVKVFPMVEKMSLADMLAVQKQLLEELEREYPELSDDIYTASGDASGRALRVKRQLVEAKVMQRRVNYDNGVVRAQQMALAIGGYRGYDAFKGFSLDSFLAGDLQHHVGKHSIFAVDPLDDVESDDKFWRATAQAVKAIVDAKAGGALDALGAFLELKGWDTGDIQKVIGAVKDTPMPQQNQIPTQPPGAAGRNIFVKPKAGGDIMNGQ